MQRPSAGHPYPPADAHGTTRHEKTRAETRTRRQELRAAWKAGASLVTTDDLLVAILGNSALSIVTSPAAVGVLPWFPIDTNRCNAKTGEPATRVQIRRKPDVGARPAVVMNAGVRSKVQQWPSGCCWMSTER
jgi:hypothetical protein